MKIGKVKKQMVIVALPNTFGMVRTTKMVIVALPKTFGMVRTTKMVIVAQLVRALVCGAGGRGFEPHQLPIKKLRFLEAFFI